MHQHTHSRRGRPGPRAQAQFTVDLTAGPAPYGRRHHHDDDRGPRGFGPGAGFGPGSGFGPGFGPGGRRRRGGRAGRGDVRAAILLLLDEQPMHGYQIIQEITERSQGAWRPSPGAVYPALGLLTDEGLVTTTAEGGRNLASLTEEGRAYVESHRAELGTPWVDAAGHGPRHRGELREAVQALAEATRQVARVGDDKQAAAALEVLTHARREIYLILAGESGGAEVDPDEQTF